MNLLRRFEGKPFRNLAYLIGSQTVNVVVEIEDSRDISEQIEAVKQGMKQSRGDQYILVLVRQ